MPLPKSYGIAKGWALAAGQAGATAPPPASVPAIVTAPSISGIAAVGEIMTVSDGTWSNGPILARSRRWQRSGDGAADWEDIGGAEGVTYTVGALGGLFLRVGTIAWNADGPSAEIFSEAVGPVATAGLAPIPLEPAEISGDAVQGATLSELVAATFGGEVDTIAREWRTDSGDVLSDDPSFILGSVPIGKSVFLRTYATNEHGTSHSDSNTIGPIAAKTYAFATSFDGTAATKLSALGWTVYGGDDAFQLNGTGGVTKPASTASAGLVGRADTAGARRQSITGLLETSVNSWFTVLAKWNGGADGYVLRKSNATQLRLQKSVGGALTNLPSSSAIEVGSATTISLSAVVTPTGVELTVKADGTPVWSYTDIAENRLSGGVAGLLYTSAGASTLCYSSVDVAASDYIGGTGVTASVVIRHGRATPALNGAMLASLPSLGLLVEGEVGAWDLIKVSGSAKYPAVVSSGFTPAPSTALTDDDAGVSTVYKVYTDGKDTGRTVTMVTQPIEEPLAAQSIASNTDILRLTKASLGGKLVEIVDGCGDSFSRATPLLFDGFTTHTGTIHLRASPGTSKSVQRIRIVNSTRILATDLRLESVLPPWDGIAYPSLPGAVVQSNMANTALLTLSNCSHVVVQRCHMGAPEAYQLSPERWQTAVNLGGAGKDAKAYGIVIGAAEADPDLSNGNTIRRCKDGINGGNLDTCTIRGNDIRYYVSNAVFLSGEQLVDVAVLENTIDAPIYNPADPADHRDSMQIGGTSVAADYIRIKVRKNKITLGAGTNSTQGLFASDVGSNSGFDGLEGRPSGIELDTGNPLRKQFLTGFKFVDCEFSNNLYQVGHGGVDGVVDRGTGWLVRNNTLMRARGQNIQYGGLKDPFWRSPTLTEKVSGTTHAPAGVMKHNLAHGFGSVTGLTTSENVSMPATGLSTVGVPSEAGWVTFYGAWFSDPDNALPLLDGPARRPDGAYAGWKNPDGSWAEGTPYAA